MRFSGTSLVAYAAATVSALPAGETVNSGHSSIPSCRYAFKYTQEDILRDPSDFISDYLYWEGQFHQNNVSYNTFNGMSYDGTQLNWTTGVATFKHPFSAASKEV